MGFDEVITLNPDDSAMIGDMLIGAAAARVPVRVAIDDGGLKVSAGRSTWTPAIGTPDPSTPVGAEILARLRRMGDDLEEQP